MLRLAHISDLHFSKLTWNPSQFLSKRWLGNLNLLLARKHAFDAEGLTTLLPAFRANHVDAVLITGDLTSTAHREEFILAQQFVESLRKENFQVFTLPGNHDHYTKTAYKQRLFYQYFDAAYPQSHLNLRDDQVTMTYMGHNFWLMALDTALATPLLSSNGYFSPELEKTLEKALEELPEGHQVIMLNHFPFFSNDSWRKSLIRKEALRKLLERFTQIKLFLHGHSHRNCVADLQSSRLPLVLDSGSTAQKKGGTWNLIQIAPHSCSVEVFKNAHTRCWEPIQKHHFTWQEVTS